MDIIISIDFIYYIDRFYLSKKSRSGESKSFMLLSTGLSFLGEIRNRKQAKGMAGENGEWGYNERKFNTFCNFEIIN